MVNAGALDKVVAANLFLGWQLLDKADTYLDEGGSSLDVTYEEEEEEDDDDA